jgi:hypothetical protein
MPRRLARNPEEAMSTALIIDPNGTIRTSDLPGREEAHHLFGKDAEPWSAAQNAVDLLGAEGRAVILWVHEWGLTQPERQVNPKAWCLYQRSPLVGPVVVSMDDDGPLPADLVRALQGTARQLLLTLAAYKGAENVRGQMLRIANEHPNQLDLTHLALLAPEPAEADHG